MAVPTVVGVGAGGGGIGAGPFTVPYPTSYSAVDDDIALIFGETQEAAVFTAPTGYAHVTGSPVIPTGGATQLAVFWKRLVAGDAAPSLSLSTGTDHLFGRMLVARGVRTAANPWNAVATGTEITADTSATWPGVTTSVADCLMLEAIATGADLATTTMVGALTNGSYTNIVEQIDQWVGSGDGGGVGVVSATMASAGATGQSTATMGTTAAKALMTLALEPPGAGGDVTIVAVPASATASLPSLTASLLFDLPAASAVASIPVPVLLGATAAATFVAAVGEMKGIVRPDGPDIHPSGFSGV